MKHQSQTDITSRVYSYGTLPSRIAPVVNEARALEQMRLATRLWNLLVAIERDRMARYKRIMQDETQDEIDQLRQKMTALRDEIKKRRASVRKRAVEIGDLKEALGEAKARISKLIEWQQSTKAERHEKNRQALDRNQERANRYIKRARQAAGRMGLFWGTYNDIVQRADAGKKHGGELRFRGFRGEGTLTAQIIGGAKADRCVGGAHTFFQIDPQVSVAGKGRWARMRIASDGHRAPVWLAIPIVYDRELPPNADIKSVSMSRRLLAGKPHWQLNVTVNLPRPQEKQGRSAVAIDIGWRLLPDGVRVAYWLDQDGADGEVLVPAADLRQFEKIRELRSICDQSRDEFLPALAAWLDDLELPEEWKARAAHLVQWRSSDRLADLIAWWREHRLSDDAEIYEAAAAWRKRYRHLSLWWRQLEDQMRLRLREQYRIFARRIADRYDVLVIEDFDLRQVVRKPVAEAEPQPPIVASAGSRQIVAPGNFRAALLNAAGREGLQVAKIPAQYTTRRCHACLYQGEWNQVESVLHRCESCNELWDQDYNAAANLLEAYREQQRGGGEPRIEDQGGIEMPPDQGGSQAGPELIAVPASRLGIGEAAGV